MNHERSATSDVDLVALANACGVATHYDGIHGRVDVPAHTVRAALAAMGHDVAEAPAAVHLERLHRRAAARAVPDTAVVRRWTDEWSAVELGSMVVEAVLRLEDGGRLGLSLTGREGGQRVELPPDAPLGYHRLEVTTSDGGVQTGQLILAPARCPFPDDLPPSWGWMLQLYAVRSRASWGLGDLGDLRELAEFSAELGAEFLVCNPLHAAAPVLPLEPSPYYPSSRLFGNPLYLRIEQLREYDSLAPDRRAEVDALGAPLRARNREDRLDRDAAWRGKLTALELMHRAAPLEGFATYREQQGQRLEAFATFCALAERHGLPYQAWPEGLRHPRSPEVAVARRALADRVEFHAWMQWLCDRQLASVQRRARDAGLRIGIVHDLAVGVDKRGADAWALQDDLASDVTIGAPPDDFNPRGQDWQLPALDPRRLRATGYAAFRDMLSSVLRHAGGIRIDHVLGLFRLFWIPQGRSAVDGTYVSYPAEELLGVLALEAARARAVVIGEDLGTVAPGARQALRDAGVLGCSVLYFERDHEGHPLRREWYPHATLASVDTHDLPTAAGWWTGAALEVQVRLGLLPEGVNPEEERRRRAAERAALDALLRREGFLHGDPTLAERVEAMHAFLGATPARLVAVALQDAVGDRRQPNLPGTVDAYPNWRLPIADADGQPLLLEELRDHPSLLRLVEVLGDTRAAAAREG